MEDSCLLWKRGSPCTVMVAAAAVAVAVLGLLTRVECRKPSLHRVGGQREGWKPNVNYTNWTTHETFYVGDWLYFGFDKRYFNVLEVNHTCYETCTDRDFIKNVTRGGRDVFNLTEPKPYYFICGGAQFCFNGMKLAVHVVEYIPPPPSLPPFPSSRRNNAYPSSSSISTTAGGLHIIIVIASLLLLIMTTAAPWPSLHFLYT
ncbi:early nodulin-like protein 20 [Malania oleifera]|uniref:early nodulin-like protein 20 n=1 Tax=Malania oleifera TaxID=397392 RepID=UPI0025ADC222|nr:early nodulin-like protein 20 [Malania oleifera]